MTGDGLFARQTLMGEQVVPPESALVIGVGGVGSYVAMYLAMVGTRTLYLVDPDVVEESNRNRVMFSRFDVGDAKVEAIRTLIRNLRGDMVNVFTFKNRIEDDEVYKVFKPGVSRGMLVFDCRDNIDKLPDWVPRCCVTGGYDGMTVTMHVNPDLSKIFQVDEIRYRTTPSYCIPPVFLGAMIVLYATCPELRTDKEMINTFDMRDLFRGITDGTIRTDDS